MLKKDFGLRKIIINFLILSISINNFITCYIVLPFNIEKKSIDKSLPIEKQLEYYINEDKIISKLSFGEESKDLLLYLTLNEYTFFLSNETCYKNSRSKSSYNPIFSNTFQNITDSFDLIVDIKKYFRAIEQCSFYNDIYLNNNISTSNLSFLFGVNTFSNKTDNTSKICGNLGLQIYNKNGEQFKNDYFVNSLKQSNIINEYTWSILYLNNTVNENDILNYTNKDYDGILICGINEKDYQSIFKTNDIKTIKAGTRFSSIYWDITNIKISYEFPEDKSNYYESFDNRITFNNEINYIICTESFFDSIRKNFFNKLIESNICSIIEKIQPMGSYVIICNNDIKGKLSDFPKILFYHDEIDFTLELTYKDLFIEYNDHILFLIIYNAYGQNIWSVGKNFMAKYPIIFNYDKKAINFVNIFNNNNNINEKIFNEKPNIYYLKLIIIILLILFSIIFIILIGMIIWYRKREKIPDELYEDYTSNKKENLKEEQNNNNNNALFSE